MRRWKRCISAFPTRLTAESVRALLLLTRFQLRRTAENAIRSPVKLLPILILAALLLMQFFAARTAADFLARFGPMAGEFLQARYPEVHAASFLVLTLLAVGNLDYGFGAGFLSFSRADIDWLFPTPVAPRAILAVRLATKSLIGILQGALIYFTFVWQPLRAAIPLLPVSLLLQTLLAIGLCVGGYANLALWAKLALGAGRAPLLRRAVVLLVGAAGLLLVGALATQGLSGLVALSQQPVAGLLFRPCKLAADAAAAPLRQTGAPGGLQELGLFYTAGLVLVFIRKTPFYEVALAGIEPPRNRTVNIGPVRRPLSPKKLPRHPLLLLLWAHSRALLRSLWVNLVLPLAGGPALLLLAGNWPPPRYPAIQSAAIAIYILVVVSVGGVHVFRQALARRTLLRPLPLPTACVVGADVLARAFPLILFCLSIGLAAGLSGERASEPAGWALAAAAPALVLLLQLVAYILAALYPSLEDRGDLFIGGLIGFFAAGVATSSMAGAWLLLLRFGLPAPAASLMLWPLCAGFFLILMPLAINLYQRDAFG